MEAASLKGIRLSEVKSVGRFECEARAVFAVVKVEVTLEGNAPDDKVLGEVKALFPDVEAQVAVPMVADPL